MNASKTTSQSNCSTAHPQKTTDTRLIQRQAILSHLKTKGTLSTIEAYQMFILAPAARIFELRRQGHNIKTYPDKKRNGMAIYHLEQDGGDS